MKLEQIDDLNGTDMRKDEKLRLKELWKIAIDLKEY